MDNGSRTTRTVLSIVTLIALLGACSPGAPAPSPQSQVIAPTVAPTATPGSTIAPVVTLQPTMTPQPTAIPTPTTYGGPSVAAPSVPQPTPNPLAGFEAAMRPAFAGDIAASANIPRYDMRIWVRTDKGILTGTQQIVFPNTTGAPLKDVALRLYQNFPPDVLGASPDVRMDVTGASVDGQPVDVRYAAEDTAVLLTIPGGLANGMSATLALTFTATIEAEDDTSFPLPSYYPMLAVRETDGWRLDVTRFPDRVYAESALYRAEINTRSELEVVATGSAVETRAEADGTMTHVVVSGSVREFAFTVGDFAVAREMAGEVSVNVYTAQGSFLDGPQIARVAAQALLVFERRFGPYPYSELDIHLFPGPYDGGSEYPGLILMSSDNQIDAIARYVAAHEVAHQWWYGVVGNDIYREPWLDEAFAQYSGIIYAEDAVGPDVAAADLQREVIRRYNSALADGDLPIGWAISDYPNFNVYYRTVYGKGALFLRTLRERLGDDAFFRALQLYYQRRRYDVATTDDVQRAFEEASGQTLEEEFRSVKGRR